jgi:xylan 1,4-beta-xylosidase
MYPFATFLAKLGSRFSLLLDAPNRRVRHSSLGHFLDAELDLVLGVRVGGVTRSVPLTRRCEPFRWCEQHLTATSVRYVATEPQWGLRFTAELVSPFYPQDERLSLAPLVYINLAVEPVRSFHQVLPQKKLPKRGQMVLELRRPGARRLPGKDGVRFEYEVLSGPRLKPDLPMPAGARPIACRDAVVSLDDGATVSGWTIRRPFDLPVAGRVEWSLQWASWCGDPAVMDCEGQPAAFKYTEHFKDLGDVLDYGRRRRKDILSRVRFFDRLFQDSSLPKSQQDLIAFSFQTYLSTTWWMRRADGRDWFSVWEGNCRFHSTVDVEYNLGLIYFALWPELLEMTLDEWRGYERDAGDGAGWMAHDMGQDLKVGAQAYPHEMEIEENANFVLMLHALWRWTGKDGLLRRHLAQARRLLEYLLRSDTTGDGIPNTGVANTIDDGSPAVQFSRKQVYLAVKSLAAIEMGAEMAAFLGDPADAKRLKARAARIRRTLDRGAWLGDHYAVCLERTTEGLVDVWSGKPLPPGPLGGWDAYSIYTANGMLYPALVGRRIGMDAGRLRTDIVRAARESLVPFGCTHSSADHSNLWVSQNLWRDYCAAYLGVDLLDLAERYAAFEFWDNTGQHACGFVDTYGENNLHAYPRGITSVGVLFAALGFSLDRKARTVRLSPVRAPLRLPLVALADWKRMRVPWAEVGLDGGRVRVKIDGRLPRGLRLRTD